MIAKMLLFLLRLYQRWLSPLFTGQCRFEPSCSQYALEAVTRYGAAKGALMAVWRLMRCQPWGRGGYDPVR